MSKQPTDKSQQTTVGLTKKSQLYILTFHPFGVLLFNNQKRSHRGLAQPTRCIKRYNKQKSKCSSLFRNKQRNYQHVFILLRRINVQGLLCAGVATTPITLAPQTPAGQLAYAKIGEKLHRYKSYCNFSLFHLASFFNNHPI